MALLVVRGIAGVRYHDQPQFCALCHNMQPYLDSYTGAAVSPTTQNPFLAYDHANQGVVCVNCHVPDMKQQLSELVKYVTSDNSAPLAQRAFPDDFCLKCHESRDAVATLTQDYTVTFKDVPQSYLDDFAKAGYQFSETMQINPHTVPAASGVTNPHEEGGPLPTCNSCHSMHRDQPGLDYCYSCHHTETFAPCSVCHSESGSDGGSMD